MTATLPATATATVLIVEDDPGIAELERDRLEEAGYHVVVASSAEEALGEVGRGGSIWSCSTTACPVRWTGWTSTPG